MAESCVRDFESPCPFCGETEVEIQWYISYPNGMGDYAKLKCNNRSCGANVYLEQREITIAVQDAIVGALRDKWMKRPG